MEQNELYHHGILGQKWGVRRYQKKDGSLTKAGEKRYGTVANLRRVERAQESVEKKKIKDKQKANADADIARIKGEKPDSKKSKKELKAEAKQKSSEEKSAVNIKKPISKMTDEEIREAIYRIQLENQLKAVMPAERNAGKEFAMKMVQEKLVPAMIDSGKMAVAKVIENANKDTEFEKLKKDAEKAKYKFDLANYNKQTSDIEDYLSETTSKERKDAAAQQRRLDALEKTRREQTLTYETSPKGKTARENTLDLERSVSELQLKKQASDLQYYLDHVGTTYNGEYVDRDRPNGKNNKQGYNKQKNK